MVSKIDTVPLPIEAQVQPNDHAQGVRLFFDLLFTAALIGLVAYGVAYLGPAISGQPVQRPVAATLDTLLPVGALILLSLVERLFPPAGPRKSLKSYLLHLQITLFYYFMAGISGALAGMGIAALAHRLGFHLGLIDLRFAAGKGMLALLGAAWLAALVNDFFFYWFHRTLHRTPFLWAHHKMHHMDPELEAITLARQNWIEVFLSALFITIPLMIFFNLDDVDPWPHGLVIGSVLLVVTTLLGVGHLNVRWQVGRASLFFCSPQIHRIHHSPLPKHHDRNFAFVLPLWDVIFGTYYAPSRDEFPPSGVEGEREIRSFIEAEIFTQREWWRMFRKWRTRRTSRHGTPP